MIQYLKNVLGAKEVQDIFETYLVKIGYPKRWIVLTDYCLDNPNTANVPLDLGRNVISYYDYK